MNSAHLDINRSSDALPSMHDMLSQLVAVNSVSSLDPDHDQSNKAVIDLLAQWSQDLGMQTNIQEVAPGKFNLIATLEPKIGQKDRGQTLDKNSLKNNGQAQPQALKKGLKKGLMFAGHTDTVGFNLQQWHQDPFELQIDDNHWVGLGVCDMKGFFPLALCAIEQAMQSNQGKQLEAPITLLATSDEETTMAGAKALARHKGLQPHHVIIGEPSEGQAIYAHKGLLTTRLTLSGIRGHASNPAIGANAIEAAHWVISQLLLWREELQGHQNPKFKIPHPTLNLGCIHGGTNSNVICDHCEILLDIRMLPDMQADKVQIELLQRLQGLDKAIPDTNVKLHVEDHCPSFAESPDSEFFQFLEKSTGQALATCDFVTEAPILQNIGHTPVILGPGSINWAHKPNERLSLDSLSPMLAILSACLNKLYK